MNAFDKGVIAKGEDVNVIAIVVSNMHGDFVLAQPAGLDRRGRREVRIVRVLESRKKQIVGRFFLENGFSYVVPDDSRIGRDILVPNEHRNGARMGQVVVVELQERSASFTQPVGIITEILGDNMAKGMEEGIARNRKE